MMVLEFKRLRGVSVHFDLVFSEFLKQFLSGHLQFLHTMLIRDIVCFQDLGLFLPESWLGTLKKETQPGMESGGGDGGSGVDCLGLTVAWGPDYSVP